jgi:hypothetical protein
VGAAAAPGPHRRQQLRRGGPGPRPGVVPHALRHRPGPLVRRPARPPAGDLRGRPVVAARPAARLAAGVWALAQGPGPARVPRRQFLRLHDTLADLSAAARAGRLTFPGCSAPRNS